MKLVKFESIQDEFVRKTPRNMTLEDVMRKISNDLTIAVENDGKGKGRTGKLVAYSSEKGKVYARIKYGPSLAFCVEDAAKTPAEAKEKVLSYAKALATGDVSAPEKEAIKKSMNARIDRMETMRSARQAKKIA